MSDVPQKHKAATPVAETTTDSLQVVREKMQSRMVETVTRERELDEKKRKHVKEMQHLLLQIEKALDTCQRIFDTAEKQRDRLDPDTRRWIRSFRSVERLLQNILKAHRVSPDEQHRDTYIVEDGATDPLQVVRERMQSQLVKAAETKRDIHDQNLTQVNQMKGLLLQIVEVIDTCQRIFDAAQKQRDRLEQDTQRWIRSFRSVQRLLQNILKDHGVRAVKTLDFMFDPQWHTVVGTVIDKQHPDTYIVEEVSKGYLWGNNVLLRTADVIVVRNEG